MSSKATNQEGFVRNEHAIYVDVKAALYAADKRKPRPSPSQ